MKVFFFCKFSCFHKRFFMYLYIFIFIFILKPLRFSLLYPGMGFVTHPLLLLPRPACKAVALKIPTRAAGGPHHLSRPVANPRHIHLHHHLYATDTPLSLGLSLVSMKGSQTGLYLVLAIAKNKKSPIKPVSVFTY